MIMAGMGNLTDGQVCGALMMCGFRDRVRAGTELLLSLDPLPVRLKRGIEMMRAAGYKDEPIVVLDAGPGDATQRHAGPGRRHAKGRVTSICKPGLGTIPLAAPSVAQTERVAHSVDHGRPGRE